MSVSAEVLSIRCRPNIRPNYSAEHSADSIVGRTLECTVYVVQSEDNRIGKWMCVSHLLLNRLPTLTCRRLNDVAIYESNGDSLAATDDVTEESIIIRLSTTSTNSS